MNKCSQMAALPQVAARLATADATQVPKMYREKPVIKTWPAPRYAAFLPGQKLVK